jgi:AraC-like DNA-binding protein
MLQSEVRSFTEPGELASAIRNAKVEISVATPGPFAASITRIRLNSLNMERVWKNRRCVSHVAPDRDRARITFHTEPGPSVIRSGTEITANNVALIAAGDPFFQQTVGPICLGTMSLPLEDLQEAGATATRRDLTPPTGHRLVTPSSGAMGTLRKLHRGVGLLAEEAPEVLAHPEVARGLEQALVQAMVACLDTDDVHGDRAAQRRSQTIMKRFHMALAADPDRPWYVLDMAMAVGASVRSLLACCQEHLGMGPKTYLQLRRMHLARRALHVANPLTTTVTDVATQYGFWQFGRFAGQYKSLFGESPSATLYGKTGKSGRGRPRFGQRVT